MPDMTVYLSDFGTASIQVMQLFQNICVRYLSIYFLKPLDLLLLKKKTEGAEHQAVLPEGCVFIFLPTGSLGGVAPGQTEQ